MMIGSRIRQSRRLVVADDAAAAVARLVLLNGCATVTLLGSRQLTWRGSDGNMLTILVSSRRARGIATILVEGYQFHVV